MFKPKSRQFYSFPSFSFEEVETILATYPNLSIQAPEELNCQVLVLPDDTILVKQNSYWRHHKSLAEVYDVEWYRKSYDPEDVWHGWRQQIPDALQFIASYDKLLADFFTVVALDQSELEGVDGADLLSRGKELIDQYLRVIGWKGMQTSICYQSMLAFIGAIVIRLTEGRWVVNAHPNWFANSQTKVVSLPMIEASDGQTFNPAPLLSTAIYEIYELSSGNRLPKDYGPLSTVFDSLMKKGLADYIGSD